MDKGIFYLVCTIVIVGVIAFSDMMLSKEIATSCKTVVTTAPEKTVVVTPTLTATPSGSIFQKNSDSSSHKVEKVKKKEGDLSRIFSC